MAETYFEPGIYSIVSVENTNLVIGTSDGKAAVDAYMGSKTQLWEVTRGIGLAWYIRSVASTNKYLGLRPGEVAKDWLELSEVEQEFPWHIRREGEDRVRISLSVPYTEFVIDLKDKATPGTILYLHRDLNRNNQKWYFNKDLHHAIPDALRSRDMYRIVNSQSDTAIQVHGGQVACFKRNNNSAQKFMARETENGWTFGNTETRLYLGLSNSTALQGGRRLSTVPEEFAWIVTPDYSNTKRFKLWIPFTSKVMDLDRGLDADDTPIHMNEDRNFDCQWWTFEPVSNAQESSLGDETTSCGSWVEVEGD